MSCMYAWNHSLYRVAQKKRNGILPVMQVYNDWYQWMGYLLLRKIIPRSAILVKSTLCQTMLGSKIFPFQLKVDSSGKNTLRLAIIVSDKPINQLCQWAFFTSALLHHKGNHQQQGGGLSLYPSPVASTAAIHSLLQS